MTGGQIMVVLIVAIVMVASILRHRMGIHTKASPARSPGIAAQDDPERKQLQDEVRQLRERIQVLERITVDKENSLARQIDELRDR